MCATAQFPSTHFISPPSKRRKTFGGGAVVATIDWVAWPLSSNFLVSSTATAEVVVDTLAASMMMLEYVWLCSDRWIFGLVGDVHLLFAWHRLNTGSRFPHRAKDAGSHPEDGRGLLLSLNDYFICWPFLTSAVRAFTSPAGRRVVVSAR